MLADARGRKLSKQNHATPVEARDAARNLRHCLALLNQPAAATDEFSSLLAEAARTWGAAKVSRTAQIGDLPL